MIELTPIAIHALRILLLCGALLYLYLAYVRQGATAAQHKLVRGFGVLLAVSSCFAFLNFGKFHAPNYGLVHYWDVYHYYMGSKYLPELGYTKLYEATYAAGVELGSFSEITHLKSLETYDPVPVSAIDRQAVEARFTPVRWQQFRDDLKVFLPVLGPWKKFFFDHGYNDTPSRALFLGVISNAVPATPWTIPALTLIDYALVTVAFGVIVCSFGFNAACLVISFFTLNFLAGFEFIGGSYLRWDWIAAVVCGVAALRSARFGLAGSLFAYAAAARVFPVVLALPLLLKALPIVGRPEERKIAGRFAGYFLGTLVAIGILTVSVMPRETLEQSVEKLKFHSSAPFSNQIGLRQIFTFASVPWKTVPGYGTFVARETARAGRESSARYWICCTLVLLPLVIYLIKRASFQRSLEYGAMLIFLLLTPTNYYYSFLVVYFLVPFEGDRLHPADALKAAFLLALMIVANVFELQSPEMLPLYFKISISLVVFFAFALIVDLCRERMQPARDDGRG